MRANRSPGFVNPVLSVDSAQQPARGQDWRATDTTSQIHRAARNNQLAK
jgi:hypothetical protein